MEAEILRDAIRIAREKKTSLADALAQEKRFPVKAIMALLGVSRKQPYFFRRGFTVTFTEPDAVPPFPSLTVTVTLYTVVAVTRGGVYTAVAPVPDTLPPVADQE